MTKKKPGRPILPDTEKRKAISVKLHPRLIEYMDGFGCSRAHAIEQAVALKHGLCPDCFRKMHKFHNCSLNPTAEGE